MSILIFAIISFFLGVIASNFVILSERKKGQDFSIKEYIHNLKYLKINLGYILVSFILLLILVKNPTVSDVIVYPFLLLGLMLAFVLDIKYMIIPDTSSVLILLAGILNCAFNFSKEHIVSSIIGLLVGGLTLFVIDFIFEKITKKTGFGFGDMKLLAAIGLFFGLKNVIVIMILSIIFSAIYGIGYIIFNKVRNLKEEYLPIGPFIVVSTCIICIVPATEIISGYLYMIDIIANKMI